MKRAAFSSRLESLNGWQRVWVVFSVLLALGLLEQRQRIGLENQIMVLGSAIRLRELRVHPPSSIRMLISRGPHRPPLRGNRAPWNRSWSIQITSMQTTPRSAPYLSGGRRRIQVMQLPTNLRGARSVNASVLGKPLPMERQLDRIHSQSIFPRQG
jgi:hypothetical protein